MLPMMRTYNNAWMPSLFNAFFEDSFPNTCRTTTPDVNVTENDKAYHLEFAYPGITKEMVDVQVTEDKALMVKIETKQEEENKSEDGTHWLRREFNYSSYAQSFILPKDVNKENIKATVNNGILSVDLPKKETEAVPEARRIEIE